MKLRNWDEDDLMKMIELEQNKTFHVKVWKNKIEYCKEIDILIIQESLFNILLLGGVVLLL